MKRILKISGIVLLVVIILLLASPFLFSSKLEALLKKNINNNLNAQVEWAEMDLSLFTNFPDATVTLKDFSVLNYAPFEGDTLAAGKRLHIQMGIKQLFKDSGDAPILVDAFRLDEPTINIKVDSLGNANYDIAKKATAEVAASTKADEENSSKGFSFDLKHYELNEAVINYLDESSQTFVRLSEVTHSGNGDLGADQSTLETTTKVLASFDLDGVNYLKENKIELEADILLDLENKKYTFQENKALINALPIEFNGFVQLLETGSNIDLSFNTPTSDFKNFLAVIPALYAKNLDGVETAGDFRLSGKIKGKATQNTIPTLDIAITSKNASFKFPDLPKRMNNIDIDVKIKNDSGLAKDTYVDINTLSFKIDDDLFSANGKLRNLTTNILVNLAIKGTLDLANIEKVYPLNLESPLEGRLLADMSTSFDMNAVEQQQYDKIKTSGQAQLSDFKYEGKQLPKPIAINKAAVDFTPSTITLNSFDGQSGSTDISATGTIENLIPFIMSKEDLKGRFKVDSERFDLNDFAVEETVNTSQKTSDESTTTVESAVQIPDFLDASIDFKAKKVIYDNLELDNVSGTVAIAEERASLSNVNSSIFGGTAGLSGNVSTRSGIPIFDMVLDLSKIDIEQSFSNLDLLKGLAPIAKALRGGLTTKINLKGQLDESFSPILETIDGDAFAQILTAQIDPEQTPLLSELNSELDFIDLTKVNLDQLKTTLSFKDGKIAVRPFDIKMQDITVNVAGGHSFDNLMNYTLTLDIPAKYLGNEVGGLLSKLTDTEKENLSVDLPVGLSGNFKQPKIQLNTQAAIKDLSNQIIEIQKQRLQNEVEDRLDDVLGDVLGDVLNGNKPKDSTATGSSSQTDAIKDVAGDLLGGLFGKKKKKKETTTVKKDSTL